MVRVLLPSAHVAAVPLATVVPPLEISTVADASSGVAVMVLVALVVVAVYAVTSGSNTGVSVSAPIVSLDRRAVKGLQPP